jgi:hypothetical protein
MRQTRHLTTFPAMARWLLIVVLLLLALAGISQLVIPPVAEHRIEDRLTDGGGSAQVSLQAFPAARLLFGDGSKLSVTGSGLNLGLQQQSNVFDKLDGFDRVDVNLTGFHAGPFAVASFDLERPAPSATYHLVSSSRTTPGDLASYGAARLGLPGGPLLRFFTDQAFGSSRQIPIDLDMELRSDDGRVVVVSGGGTVAGYPTGPLAELITSTIAVRL